MWGVPMETGAVPVGGPGPVSVIAAERVGPGPASWGFRLVAAGIGAVLAALLWGLASRLGDPTGAEAAVLDADGPWSAGVSTMGVEAARSLSAVASGAAAVALAFLGRRLLHSDVAGGMATLLLALDPAFLLWGHTALPHATLLALLLGAVWLLLVPRPAAHWGGAALLAAAAFLEPWTLLWSLPLSLLVLVRGHVYASAAHLGTSLVQCALLPGVAAVAGLLLGAPGASCLRGTWPEEMFLDRALEVAPGQVALHNPALWFGGLAAALALALAAVVRTAMQFRLARLPGRLQIRLPEPIPPLQARSLWILGLVFLAPHPALLWPLLALGLAAGIADLGKDAPGFGLALAVASLAFAGLYLVQSWPAVWGAGDYGQVEELLGMLPWGRVAGC